MSVYIAIKKVQKMILLTASKSTNIIFQLLLIFVQAQKLTWYIWELLCSEGWFVFSRLADKALPRGAVDDEGAACLTQKALQEPEEQRGN